MSEQELREGLLAAVGDEPALAFDPDALMQRARRDIKRRRALFGAGTATVAVAVAAVAVPAMLGVPRVGNTAGGGGPGPAGCPSVSVSESAEPPVITYRMTAPSNIDEPPSVPSGPPSQPPTTTVVPPTEPAQPCASTPSDPPSSPEPPTISGSVSATPPKVDFAWPPPDVVKKKYTAEQLRARGEEMRKYLLENFAKAVVGATKVSVDKFGGEAEGEVADGQTYLNTFVGYTLKGTTSAVAVAVFAPGEGPSPQQACTEGYGCTTLPGRAGDHLITTKFDAGAGREILTVTHYRSDGAVVAISGYNYNPTAEVGLQPSPEMPVTVDQLTKLATDPKLGI